MTESKEFEGMVDGWLGVVLLAKRAWMYRLRRLDCGESYA